MTNLSRTTLWKKKNQEMGRCTTCTNPPEDGYKQCSKCRERNKLHNRTSYYKHHGKRKAYRNSLKDQVFTHYSNTCACCGESERAFLQIDHINGDGRKHRSKVGTGQRLLKWIIKNNFPTNLQLLCANCNYGKLMNGGICPHKPRPFIPNYVI